MINEQLLTYIRDELALGAPREAITHNLKGVGWKDEDIALAFAGLNPVKVEPAPVSSTPVTNQTTKTWPAKNPQIAPQINTRTATPAVIAAKPATSVKTAAPSKTSYIKYLLLFIVLIALAGGVYFYFLKTNVPTQVLSDASVNVIEPSFITTFQRIPDRDNSAALFNPFPQGTVSVADSVFLTKYAGLYSATNTPNLIEARKIIARNAKPLAAFDASAAILGFQCSMDMGDSCALNIVKQVALLASLKSYILLKDGKPEEATKYARAIVALGQKMTKDSDGVTYILGLYVQKIGYSTLVYLNSASKSPLTLSDTEKQTLISNLRSDQKNLYKLSYTRMLEIIDSLNSSTTKPTNLVFDTFLEETLDEYRKQINSVTWDMQETKQLITQAARIDMKNIDAPCGQVPAESRVDVGLLYTSGPKNQKNYVGKTLYNNYNTIQGFILKRCEIEGLIGKI